MLVNVTLSIEDYIQAARNQSGVISIPTRFNQPTTIDDIKGIFAVTNTKCKQLFIRSHQEWNEFIHGSYSLACLNPFHNWKSVGGKKKGFLDWMRDENARAKANDPNQDKTRKCYFFKLDYAKFTDNIIVTVTDSHKEKTLIVDGLHRAAALTMASEDGMPFPETRIYDCYGENVDVIYPCDVHQL